MSEKSEERLSYFNTLGYARNAQGANSWLASRSLTEALLIELQNDKRDWEFVLKYAALSEAFVSDYLRRNLSPEDLITFNESGVEVPAKYKKMSVRKDSTLGQKVALCDFRQLFEPQEIAWLRAVNEIRNSYAHYIENLDVPMWQLIQKHERGLDICDGLLWANEDVGQRRRMLASQQEDLNVRNSFTKRYLPRVFRSFANPGSTIAIARADPASRDKMMQTELRRQMLATVHSNVGAFGKTETKSL